MQVEIALEVLGDRARELVAFSTSGERLYGGLVAEHLLDAAGVGAGVLPALKAARLAPIDALRSE